MADVRSANEVSLQELWYILRRRWMFIAVCAGVGTALAIALGLQQPNLYRATTLLMAQPQQARIGAVENVIDRLPTDSAMLETHVKRLQSRDQAMRVIEALHLTDQPEFQPAVESDSLLERLQPGAMLQTLLRAARQIAAALHPTEAASIGSEPGEAAGATPFPIEPREFAFAVFQQRLRVVQDGKSYLIALSFSSRDQAMSALIANKAAEQYLDLLRQERRQATLAANDWLFQRLGKLREDYLDMEARLQRFRIDHGIVTTNGVEVNEKQFADLNEELIKIRAEKSARAAKLNLVRDLFQRRAGLDTVAEVVDSPLIGSLRQEEIQLARKEAEYRKDYGDRHPTMIALAAERDRLRERVSAEIGRIVASLGNAVQEIEAREANIQDEIDRVREATNRMGEPQLELRELERQADAARRLYEAFLQRFEETKQQPDLLNPDIAMISQAAPPLGPDKIPVKFFAVLGLVGSTVLGGLAALLKDRMTMLVRSRGDVELASGLTCVSMVPELTKRQSRAGPVTSILDQPMSGFTESIHAAVLALQAATADLPGRTVTVTSALPGEGKTTAAMAIAVMLAKLGQRVLLVDLDLRHPTVTRRFRHHPRHDVTSVLLGQSAWGEAVACHGPTGVHLLALSDAPKDPIAILTAPGLPNLLRSTAAAFDWVIVDSPPTLAVSDARLIAKASDLVLFVAAWNRTPLRAMKAAIKDIRAVGVQRIVALVNMVEPARHQLLGYGPAEREHYYRAYRSYHHDQ